MRDVYVNGTGPPQLPPSGGLLRPPTPRDGDWWTTPDGVLRVLRDGRWIPAPEDVSGTNPEGKELAPQCTIEMVGRRWYAMGYEFVCALDRNLPEALAPCWRRGPNN